MKKKVLYLRLFFAFLFSWLYLPHFVAYLFSFGGGKKNVDSDLDALWINVGIKVPRFIKLIYLIHVDRYFRTLFYHRIGRLAGALIGWWRPGDKYFTISSSCKIGKSFWYAHPYSTILAANSIGDNFRCVHGITVGNTKKGKPTIGDNVSVGANAVIIGPVKIGNNVSIGAGTIVVKDVPDNAIVVGNPGKVIKYKE